MPAIPPGCRLVGGGHQCWVGAHRRKQRAHRRTQLQSRSAHCTKRAHRCKAVRHIAHCTKRKSQATLTRSTQSLKLARLPCFIDLSKSSTTSALEMSTTTSSFADTDTLIVDPGINLCQSVRLTRSWLALHWQSHKCIGSVLVYARYQDTMPMVLAPELVFPNT